MLPGIEYNTDLNSDTVTSSLGVVTVGKLGATGIAASVLKIAASNKDFVSSFTYEVSKHRCYKREVDGLAAKMSF